jgi:hypothetical protein
MPARTELLRRASALLFLGVGLRAGACRRAAERRNRRGRLFILLGFLRFAITAYLTFSHDELLVPSNAKWLSPAYAKSRGTNIWAVRIYAADGHK